MGVYEGCIQPICSEAVEKPFRGQQLQFLECNRSISFKLLLITGGIHTECYAWSAHSGVVSWNPPIVNDPPLGGCFLLWFISAPPFLQCCCFAVGFWEGRDVHLFVWED